MIKLPDLTNRELHASKSKKIYMSSSTAIFPEFVFHGAYRHTFKLEGYSIDAIFYPNVLWCYIVVRKGEDFSSFDVRLVSYENEQLRFSFRAAFNVDDELQENNLRDAGVENFIGYVTGYCIGFVKMGEFSAKEAQTLWKYGKDD